MVAERAGQPQRDERQHACRGRSTAPAWRGCVGRSRAGRRARSAGRRSPRPFPSRPRSTPATSSTRRVGWNRGAHSETATPSSTSSPIATCRNSTDSAATASAPTTVPGTRPTNAAATPCTSAWCRSRASAASDSGQARDQQRPGHEGRVEEGEQRRRGEGEAEADGSLHAGRDCGEQGRHCEQQHAGSIVPPCMQSAAWPSSGSRSTPWPTTTPSTRRAPSSSRTSPSASSSGCRAPSRRRDGLPYLTGVVGADLTLEQGYEAARYAALSALIALHHALGDLDRMLQVVQMTGWVNSAPGFNDQPRVINGATDLLVEVYGQRGLGTRAAIGCTRARLRLVGGDLARRPVRRRRRSPSRCRRLAQRRADAAGEHARPAGARRRARPGRRGRPRSSRPASMPASRAGVSVAARIASANRTPAGHQAPHAGDQRRRRTGQRAAREPADGTVGGDVPACRRGTGRAAARAARRRRRRARTGPRPSPPTPAAARRPRRARRRRSSSRRRRASSSAPAAPGSRWWNGRIALNRCVPSGRAGVERGAGASPRRRSCGRARRARRRPSGDAIAARPPVSSGASVTSRTVPGARNAGQLGRRRRPQGGGVVGARVRGRQPRPLQVDAGQPTRAPASRRARARRAARRRRRASADTRVARNVVTPDAAIRARAASRSSGVAKSTPNAPFSWMSTSPGTIQVPSGASRHGSMAAIRSSSTTTRHGPSGSGASTWPRNSTDISGGDATGVWHARGMRELGHVCLGSWSGGRHMHFGEPLDEERLVALLRPDEQHPLRRHLRRVRRGRGRRARRARARRASTATPTASSAPSGTTSTRRARRREGLPALHRPAAARPGRYADYLRMAAERSLERCGADRFDLLLLHNPDRIGYSSRTSGTRSRGCATRAWQTAIGVAPGPANGFTLDVIAVPRAVRRR